MSIAHQIKNNRLNRDAPYAAVLQNEIQQINPIFAGI